MNEKKRENSIKVPRLYKLAASILKDYYEGEGSVKNLIFGAKKFHPNMSAITALVSNCVKNEKKLDQILTKKVGLFDREPRFDINLAYILTTELLWGKMKLGGKSLPILTLLKYESEIQAAAKKCRFVTVADREAARPRYARVNTLITNLTSVIERLESIGFQRCLEFEEKAKDLQDWTFIVDPDVPNLLIFPSRQKFHQFELVDEGLILPQDKASCLPVMALNPSVGSTVLDACAAPGMKTVQLAAAITTGRIYAVEINEKRWETLNHVINRSGADSIVETFHRDFLCLDPNDFMNVKFILLDPSCSGSGMLKHESDEAIDQSKRLQRLASLQTKMLKHAMSFPNVERIVYSTCSIFSQENEDVVEKALEGCNGLFHLVPCLPNLKWAEQNRSSQCSDYFWCDSSRDLCNGFFVALLHRSHCEDLCEKKQRNVSNSNGSFTNGNDMNDDVRIKIHKKRKKHKNNDKK